MPDSELRYLSAGDAVRRFQAGTLSPPQLMRAVLDAAHAQRETLNATTAIFADSAMAAAEESARRYRNGTARALEGVPVAVKEETAVRGWRTTYGSLVQDRIPEENHPIIDKLLDAGAIPHIQTTTPEFSCLGQTWSRRWGVTRNPWNLRYTCGGSSGGTAAALAAGCAPLGTGSDMAGSIRMPAAFQGLYGYRPPFGRIPCAPGDELFAFAVEGPLARTFEDLVLMLNVMAGPHPASYAALPFAGLPQTYDDLAGWRIAYSDTLGCAGVCPDVRRNLHRALDGLRRRGAVIEPVDIRWDLDAISDVLVAGIFGLYYGEYLATMPEDERARLTTYVRATWEKFAGKPQSIAAAAACASRLHQDMERKVWGAGYRAFICPTTFTTAVEADFDPSVDPTVAVGDAQLEGFLGWTATPPFNLLGRYPVIAAPTGRAGTGVPTSMQIVAAPYQDHAVFQVAANHAAADVTGFYTHVFPEPRA